MRVQRAANRSDELGGGAVLSSHATLERDAAMEHLLTPVRSGRLPSSGCGALPIGEPILLDRSCGQPKGRTRRTLERVDGCLFCMQDDRGVNTIVAENETCFVRLDNFPAAEGHVEIVPKRHVASYFDLLPEEVRDIHELLLLSRARLDATFSPDGYTIGVNEGEAAGRTVHHVHVHLVPRHVGDVADPRGGIRRALPNGDPDAWRPAAHARAAG